MKSFSVEGKGRATEEKLLAYPKIKVDYCISVSIVDLLGGDSLANLLQFIKKFAIILNISYWGRYGFDRHYEAYSATRVAT